MSSSQAPAGGVEVLVSPPSSALLVTEPKEDPALPMEHSAGLDSDLQPDAVPDPIYSHERGGALPPPPSPAPASGSGKKQPLSKALGMPEPEPTSMLRTVSGRRGSMAPPVLGKNLPVTSDETYFHEFQVVLDESDPSDYPPSLAARSDTHRPAAGETGSSQPPREYRRYVYPNGAIYEGEVSNRRWDGTGTLWLPNGDWYSGSFSQGMRHGYGTYSFADGTVYRGDWVRGVRQGKGKLFSPQGDLYDGDWFENVPHGRGRYRFSNGDLYSGNFRAGSIDGSGTYTRITGEQYRGEWRNGARHGQGTLQDSDGNVFEGVFSEDRRAKGVYTLSDGSRFDMVFDSNDEAVAVMALPPVAGSPAALAAAGASTASLDRTRSTALASPSSTVSDTRAGTGALARTASARPTAPGTSPKPEVVYLDYTGTPVLRPDLAQRRGKLMAFEKEAEKSMRRVLQEQLSAARAQLVTLMQDLRTKTEALQEAEQRVKLLSSQLVRPAPVRAEDLVKVQVPIQVDLHREEVEAMQQQVAQLQLRLREQEQDHQRATQGLEEELARLRAENKALLSRVQAADDARESLQAIQLRCHTLRMENDRLLAHLARMGDLPSGVASPTSPRSPTSPSTGAMVFERSPVYGSAELLVEKLERQIHQLQEANEALRMAWQRAGGDGDSRSGRMRVFRSFPSAIGKQAQG